MEIWSSWSSSSSVLPPACLFLSIDLMPSEPEVKSSRLPWPLLLAPLFFKMDEMAPAILWSGLALPKLNFRFRIPWTGGSGEDLEVAPEVPAEAEMSPSMMRSS